MEEEKKFTLEEIRNYLEKCDSFGDALHFLTEENIEEANQSEKNEDYFTR